MIMINGKSIFESFFQCTSTFSIVMFSTAEFERSTDKPMCNVMQHRGSNLSNCTKLQSNLDHHDMNVQWRYLIIQLLHIKRTELLQLDQFPRNDFNPFIHRCRFLVFIFLFDTLQIGIFYFIPTMGKGRNPWSSTCTEITIELFFHDFQSLPQSSKWIKATFMRFLHQKSKKVATTLQLGTTIAPKRNLHANEISCTHFGKRCQTASLGNS